METPGHNTTYFHSNGNSGLQLGHHSGQLNVAIHQYGAPADFRGTYSHGSLRLVRTFTQRPQLQKQIAEQLRSVGGDRENRILIVSGLGGAGKSQLTLNYLESHRGDYKAVLWIDATSKDTIERDFGEFFAILYPARHVETGSDTKISMIKAWLQGGPGLCLLIFDGADEILDESDPLYVDVEHYLPSVPGVHVIVSTRISAASRLSPLQPVVVQEMEEQEALGLLQASIGRKDQETEAKAIVQELGNFALAISLAGAYISRNSAMLANLGLYLKKYNQDRDKLLRWCPKRLIHQYGRNILTAWEISYQAIERQSDLAIRLLTCFSFLDGSDIMLGLFMEETEEQSLSEAWKSIISPRQDIDTDAFYDALDIIVSYSFINPGATNRSYSMHKLVSDWAIDRLEDKNKRRHIRKILAAIVDTVGALNIRKPQGRRFCQHGIHNFNIFQKITPNTTRNDIRYMQRLCELGDFLKDLRKWTEVKRIQGFAYRCFSTYLGEGAHWTSKAAAGLGTSMRKLGELEEVRVMMTERVERLRDHTAESSLVILVALTGLSHTYFQLQNLSKALELQDEAIQISAKTFGDNHATTLELKGLACWTLIAIGDLGRAESTFRQINDVLDHTIGFSMSDLIEFKQRLSTIRSKTMQYDVAISIYEQRINEQTQTHGPESKEAVSAMHDLARYLSNEHRFKEAEEPQRRLLTMRQKSLGQEHPDTLDVMGQLAETLREQGMTEEALTFAKETFERRDKLYGKTHPDTLESMGELARCQSAHGDSDAIFMYEEWLKGCKETFGDNNLETIMALSYWAEETAQNGAVQKASAMFVDAIDQIKADTKNRQFALFAATCQRFIGFLTRHDRSLDGLHLAQDALGVRDDPADADAPLEHRFANLLGSVDANSLAITSEPSSQPGGSNDHQ